MITLADSRYGMLTVSCLVIMRLLFVGRMHTLAILLPAICVGMLLIIVVIMNGHYSDNILGRLYATGATIMEFGPKEIFGLKGYEINFGDMGYAVVLTRFGLIFFTVCWIGFWLIKMEDERGVRFRAYVALYASLIMAVSGTSLLALKTSGILWFLVGCLAVHKRVVDQKAAADGAEPTRATNLNPRIEPRTDPQYARRTERKVNYAN
jgi:putative polymerase